MIHKKNYTSQFKGYIYIYICNNALWESLSHDWPLKVVVLVLKS